MKKPLLIALGVCLCLSLTGCGAGEPSGSGKAATGEFAAQAEAASAALELPPDAISIREKMFIAQVNDIYANADDYLGKTIQMEGILDSYPYTEAGDLLYTVIRYGPGCCGNDGNVGFEVLWDQDYPENGDWVNAVGTLERYEDNGADYLRLRLSQLTKMETRGLETVTQ